MGRTFTDAASLFAFGSGFLSFAMGFAWVIGFGCEWIVAAQFEADCFLAAPGPEHIPFRQTDFARRFFKQAGSLGNGVEENGRGFSAARRAPKLVFADFFGGLEDILMPAAFGTFEALNDFACQVDGVDSAQMLRGFMP